MTQALHFIGISGIGMSALARIALARGYSVSGSSDKANDTTRKLEAEGATVTIGHRAENITGTPRIVVTSAVGRDNPELRHADVQGLAILGRGALLAEFFNVMRGVAVAGTHGKTTVTGMLATIFEEAGLDPTVAVGGLRRESGTNFRCGRSDWFLSEADESDGSFMQMHPHIGIVLNLENDHIVSDDGMATLREQFSTFLHGISPAGVAILGVDDVESARLVDLPLTCAVRTFGFSDAAEIRAGAVRAEGLGTRFEVFEDGRSLGEIVLGVPGKINAANALAAIAASRAAGIPFAPIAAALAKFGGVRRRFDILSTGGRFIVVDDYAHHPTAVAATIAAARNAHAGPIVVAFQAHRFTRTAYLADDFARSLTDADTIILPEIYAASEDPLPGVSEKSIGEPLRAVGADVRYISRADLVERIYAETPQHAMVLMLGAGDITAAAHELATRLSADIDRTSDADRASGADQSYDADQGREVENVLDPKRALSLDGTPEARAHAARP